MKTQGFGTVRKGYQWVWMECCRDTILYYQWFLRKRNVWLNEPVWKSHVTIVRDSDEQGGRLDSVEEGLLIPFEYDPEEIFTNGSHWWIEVDCPAAANLRKSLGLEPIPEFDFHLTIGKEYQRGLGTTFGKAFVR